MKKYNYALSHFGEIHTNKKSKTTISRIKEKLHFYKVPLFAIVERIAFITMAILIGQLIISFIKHQ